MTDTEVPKTIEEAIRQAVIDVTRLASELGCQWDLKAQDAKHHRLRKGVAKTFTVSVHLMESQVS